MSQLIPPPGEKMDWDTVPSRGVKSSPGSITDDWTSEICQQGIFQAPMSSHHPACAASHTHPHPAQAPVPAAAQQSASLHHQNPAASSDYPSASYSDSPQTCNRAPCDHRAGMDASDQGYCRALFGLCTSRMVFETWSDNALCPRLGGAVAECYARHDSLREMRC